MLRNLSIRLKLILIAAGISAISLLLAGAGISIYEYNLLLSDTKGQLASAAEMIGTNTTAALSFQDRHAAEDTLRGLAAMRQVTAGCLYGQKGMLFAAYKGPCPEHHPLTAGHYYQGDSLVLHQPIQLDGDTMGAIALRFDTAVLKTHLQRFLLWVGLLLGVSLLVAGGLSSRWQQVISGPIVQLAGVARHVSATHDYSQRAAKQGGDEVGQLVDGFNDMLAPGGSRHDQPHPPKR